MSVQIGQFRRNQKKIDFFQEQITSKSSIDTSFTGSNGIEYYEFAIKNPNSQSFFTEKQTYYFSGYLKGNSYIVKLVNSTSKTQQVIGKFTGYATFTFTPNRPDYDYLVFALEKTTKPNDISYQLYKLGNICGDSETKVPKKVKKIGIQGMPGLRFSINGEDFIMGKSGIFMLGDMDITQISFFVRDFSKATESDEKDPATGKPKVIENYINYFPYVTDGKEFFIMDYEY